MTGPDYRGILFDLFGTLVLVDETRLPELVVGDRRVRTTVAGLGPLLGEWAPDVTLREFAEALRTVSGEMARVRTRDHVELPSRERFRRALSAVGVDGGRGAEAAVQLSRAHLAGIAETTVLPPAHRALLDAARARCRVALVSNFDDTSTAYEILRRHAVLDAFDTIVVSEAIGLRKPHPAVVRTALAGLGVPADRALFVGDTFGEDVLGAHAAGVDAAWIDARGSGPPPEHQPPRHVIRTLPELAACVGLG